MASYAYRPGNFCRVPMPLQVVRLKHSAPSVFLALCYHADANGRCWPSRAKLAEEVGVSVDTVDRAMKDIERAGLVSVTRRDDTSNVYQLTVSDGEVAAPLPLGGRTDAATPSRTGAALTRLIGTKPKELPAGAVGGQSTDSQEEKAVGEVIKAFEPFTPEAKNFYARPPQREAARALVRDPNIGLSRVKVAMATLYKNREDRFAPLVDSPLELSQKWAKVYRYVKPRVTNDD